MNHPGRPILPQLLAGLACFLSVSAAEPVPEAYPTTGAAPAVVQAEPRSDANSKRAHEQLLAKAHQGRIDLYFVGDSITRRWGCTDPQYRDFMAHWTTNFFGWNAGNFGWGADSVRNILWRLENGEIDGVDPKVIVFMGGTNDIGPRPVSEREEDRTAGEIVRGIQAAVEVMRRKATNATILLMGITPRNDGGTTRQMPLVNKVNAGLAKLADGKRTRFLLLNDKLADREGRLVEGMTVDGLHLSLRGYQVWADALRPHLIELLGPRAATDQAPPPTGDPSLGRR